MANLGYILKESVMESTEGMTDSEFRETITALFNYAVYGEEVNIKSNLGKIVFKMEKPAIDANNKKWFLRKESFEKNSGRDF